MYLEEDLLFHAEPSDRLRMASCLLQGMNMYAGMTISQMKVYLQIHTGLPDDEDIFEKYVTLLQQNDLFEDVKGTPQLSGPLFRLKSGIDTPDKLDESYIEAIGKELANRYKELTNSDVLDLLFALPQEELNI